MHQAFANELWRIANQEGVEYEWRKMWDGNCIYKYYDTNKALRVLQATLDGRAEGTCVKENTDLYVKQLDYEPQAYFAKYTNITDDPEYKNRVMHHFFIVVKIDGKLYYETRANGLHKRMPLEEWKKKLNFIHIERPFPKTYRNEDGLIYLSWEYE